ncbi:hypothetical protein D3C87_2112310 [compost metagenome]
MWPGAWAPSMTEKMLRRRASATARSIGKTRAVAEVMWLKNSTRVRSVMPASSASVNCASVSSGIGMLTTTISAPVLAQI